MLFRVSSSSMQFLNPTDEVDENGFHKFEVRSARPATQQETEMWSALVAQASEIQRLLEANNPTGVDAHSVRDSLGRPKGDPNATGH